MSMTTGRRIAVLAAAGLQLLFSGATHAQAPFFYTVRPQGYGMRAAALAEASSADGSDVSGMYWNPGCLVFLKNEGVLVSHVMDVSTRAQVEHLAGSVRFGHAFALGVSGVYSHEGRLELENGPEVPLEGHGVDLAGAYAFAPTLSLGVLAGFRKLTFDAESRTTGWGQIGLFYFPSQGVSYGFVYRAARGYTYWHANQQSGVERETDLLQNIEIGATMSYPARAEDPIVTLSLTTEKSFPGVSLFSTKGGLELLPVRFLAVRVGFKVGTLERVARYGFGLKFGRVHIDFAAGPSRAESRFTGVSLMVNL